MNKIGETFLPVPERVACQRGLASTAKLTCGAIARKMEDGEASIGVRLLAKMCGCAESSIKLGVHQLEEAGILVVTRGRSGQRAVYKWAGNQPASGPKISPVTDEKRAEKLRALDEKSGPKISPLSKQSGPKISPEAGRKSAHVEKEKTIAVDKPPRARPKSNTSKSKKPKKEEPKPRERNVLWDAVEALFFGGNVTATQRTRCGRIVKFLKEKNATPEEIPIRLARYRADWPNAADTPEALIKHWDRYAQENQHVRPDRLARIEAPPGKYDNIGITVDATWVPPPAGAVPPAQQEPPY